MPLSVQVSRHIPYTSDSSNPKLQLDLYVNVGGAHAANTAPVNASTSVPTARPLIVYIHGGLWADGDKNAHCNIGLTLAERCNAHVAVINYRLLKTDNVHWPVYMHDVVHALIWLQQPNNQQHYALEFSSIVLVGHSVGATMASLLALTDDVRPSGVSTDAFRNLRDSISRIVCLQGMYDLTAYVKRYTNWASAVTGPLTEDTSTWQEPQKYVNRLAASYDAPDAQRSKVSRSQLRWLILHSPDDEWVNTEQTTDFAEKLITVYGVDAVTVRTDITGGHHDVVKNIGIANDTTTKLSTSFIRSHDALPS